jgi:hypothetical protein
MALRSLQRRFQKGEAGFILMEVVVAAVFSAVALTASIHILNRQSNMAFKARDLAMIQAAVNEDINSIRHEARFWKWLNSYYRPNVPSGTPPNELVYQPLAECRGWDYAFGGRMEADFRSDIGEYTNIPGAIPITKSVIAKTVPGYDVRRTISIPPTFDSSNNASTTTSGDRLNYTIRVTYTAKPLVTNPNGVKTFDSTTDILIPAQFSC